MIRTDMSNKEYHADRVSVSSSGLKLFLDDPVAYHKQYILGEKREIPNALQNAFDFGSYIHTHVLEPHLLEEEYAIYEDGCREAFKSDNEGKILISSGQEHIARRMIDGYKSTTFHPDGKPISSFFTDGIAEESMFGEIDGLRVKIRTDYRKVEINEITDLDGNKEEPEIVFASINDVKTTSKNVNFKNIKKACEEYSYDLSAALYVDIAKQVTGIDHDFYFMFMGKKDYKSEVFRASEEFLERGREKYKRAIKGIKKSLETGVWLQEV